jgi:hypothetical protein
MGAFPGPDDHLRAVPPAGLHACQEAAPQGAQAVGLPPSKSCTGDRGARKESNDSTGTLGTVMANVTVPSHQWLVSRAEMARVDPAYAYPQSSFTPFYGGQQNQYYGMQAMPPPVYDPNAPRPPIYQPEGATKVDPSQYAAEPTHRPADQQAEEYAAPSGPPPPSAMRPQGTGNSNPFRG